MDQRNKNKNKKETSLPIRVAAMADMENAVRERKSGSHYQKQTKTKKKKEQSLDMCLRLLCQEFMWFSLPDMTTILDRLIVSSSSPSFSSSSSCKHKHNLKEAVAVPLATAAREIANNRFPLLRVDKDYFKGPPPIPGKPGFFVSSAVVGSTLYCLGGDRLNIHCYHDIEVARALGPTPYIPPLPSYSPPPSYDAFSLLNFPNPWGDDPEDVVVPIQTQMETTTLTLPPRDVTPKIIEGICYKPWTFDLRNPELGWSQGKPLISPRLYPVLVSYQRKLYAFSGNLPSLPFAEVHDPISDTWTQLPPPPFRWLPDTLMYVIPLKGWNKIWVLGHYRPITYTFDVVTWKWQKCIGSRDIVPLIRNKMYLVSALIPDTNHMAIYWINDDLIVHAYDLTTNQFFEGTIAHGTGRVPPEEYLATPFCLRHLRRDLFCLMGTTCHSERTSLLHVTILQISVKPYLKPIEKANPMLSKSGSKTSRKPLNAAILGCFAYPLKGEFNIEKSHIMSNNIDKGNA